MAFDFSQITAPFRMQPGLRRIAVGTAQLTPARVGSRHLREKLTVLSAFTEEALMAVPGYDAHVPLAAIAAEAAKSPPAAIFADGPGADGAITFDAPLLGWRVDAAGRAVGTGDDEVGRALRAVPCALRATALLALAFEEDFAVIDGATGRVPWLAVALPSRWAPADKLGKRFADVHAPVADNAQLLSAADALARLVTAEGDRWERFVWTITPDPRLHQHPARGKPAWPEIDVRGSVGMSADCIARNAYFRSERQTFIPMAGSGQAVFTIHVESAPLSDAVGSAEAARRVHDALASMSVAVLAYRDLTHVREPLLHWLAARARSEAPRP